MKIPNDITITQTGESSILIAQTFDLDLFLFQIFIFLLPVPYFAYLLGTSMVMIMVMMTLIILWMVHNIIGKYLIIVSNSTITFKYGLLNLLKEEIFFSDFNGFEENYKEINKWRFGYRVKDQKFFQLYIKSKKGKFQIGYYLSNKEKLFIKDFLISEMKKKPYNNGLLSK